MLVRKNRIDMGYAEKANMFNINHRPFCFILTARSQITPTSFG